MKNSVSPNDLIETTADLDVLIGTGNPSQHPYFSNIQLPKGTLLLSRAENYTLPEVYSFTFWDRQQKVAIYNLYIPKFSPATVEIDSVCHISVEDLKGNFIVIKEFSYEALESTILSHLKLFAYLFLDGKINELPASKQLKFVADFNPLEKIKRDYELQKISQLESVNLVVKLIIDAGKYSKQ